MCIHVCRYMQVHLCKYSHSCVTLRLGSHTTDSSSLLAFLLTVINTMRCYCKRHCLQLQLYYATTTTRMDTNIDHCSTMNFQTSFSQRTVSFTHERNVTWIIRARIINRSRSRLLRDKTCPCLIHRSCARWSLSNLFVLSQLEESEIHSK